MEPEINTDAVLEWLKNGGKLDGMTAVVALATIVRFALVPIARRVTSRLLNREVTGASVAALVYAASFALIAAINQYTHGGKSLIDMAVFALVVAVFAVGGRNLEKLAPSFQGPEKPNEAEDREEATDEQLP
jgi:hypothetical protein